jgi:chromosome segregation ATPase
VGENSRWFVAIGGSRPDDARCRSCGIRTPAPAPAAFMLDEPAGTAEDCRSLASAIGSGLKVTRRETKEIAMPTNDFGADLEKLEKRLEALQKGNDKLETMFKKKRQEFETINSALWEGKKDYDDTKKDLKTEKNATKIGEMAEQLQETEKTFDKMTKKLGGIVKELNDMGTTGSNLERTIKDEEKNLDKLEKDIKRTGGEIAQLKEWAEMIKKLGKGITFEATRAFTIADEVKNLPKTPELK